MPERVTPNIRVHSLHTPADPGCPLSTTYNRSSFKLSIRFTAANFFVFLALPMVDGVLCLVEGRWLVGELELVVLQLCHSTTITGYSF